jgi:hypothetical protein
MKPIKEGTIVKFHTPLADENPDQLFVVLELFDREPQNAKIMALNTGLNFPPVNTVNTEDLIPAPVPTDDLMGRIVTIIKPDNLRVQGVVNAITRPGNSPEMTLTPEGVIVDLVVTVNTKQGEVITGKLFVS